MNRFRHEIEAEARRRREQNMREFHRAIKKALIEFMIALMFAAFAFWVLVEISAHYGK